ncbi:apolipoprotein A1/A4/E family protein [Microbacterium sp. SSW1-49]|uniref:Apolipoprotein A1/A4/E family protein n=1 Tax=Microbacterium croceum TaxID=2851645 RepID=A0ABT0F9G3_9MICO|nr:apolipoprotein A1/A4/E family protein [Microbacterium croceum]
MSAEILAIVVSAVGIVLTLGTTMLAGFAWCVRRIDAVDHRLGARIDELDHRLTARIDALDQRLGARIDELDQRLGARIDELDHRLTARVDTVIDDTTALKIAVARWEGPVRHLVLPGH